jgi:prolyl 4-hydroxylase
MSNPQPATASAPNPSPPPSLEGKPGALRFPNDNLELFMVKGFLTPDECAGLVERIDAGCRPSTIADHNGQDAAFRTSSTCDLNGADPLVAAVNQRICALTGLDPGHGEPMQGQRYLVGQEFKPHTDFFEPGGVDFATYCSVSGQRTWTVMIYLNQPIEGGATGFPHLKVAIRAELGALLAWNNLDLTGKPNPWTLHHGMKVVQGAKYVITKWFRERPWA